MKSPQYLRESDVWVGVQKQRIIITSGTLERKAELIVLLCLRPPLAAGQSHEFMQK
jgi:hypothetical protein